MPTTTKINASFLGKTVIAENKGLAKEFYSKSRFGEEKDKKIQYMLVEALYLIEIAGQPPVQQCKKKVQMHSV